MSNAFLYGTDDPFAMYQQAMMQRAGVAPRRFDEYYRCYPVAMLPGPERESANHGGKIFLPTSALEKLTRLHISYPMLFELINGRKEKQTHAGVLEFTAEEGKIYLPYWLMQTLLLEAGDLLQIKSTDLPPGAFIKLQPQSPDFLDITDPKAVLENAFRNFSCLTVGDVFSFSYNDSIYEIAVLEVKPDTRTHAICTMETDLSVDFATPIGYEEPIAKPRTAAQKGKGSMTGGILRSQGTMAQAINYAAIVPNGEPAAIGAAAASTSFAGVGHKLVAKRGGKGGMRAPPTTTDDSGSDAPIARIAKRNGPQPLRLPPGMLFFGFQVKPLRKTGDKKETDEKQPRFTGQGQTLRKKKGDISGPPSG